MLVQVLVPVVGLVWLGVYRASLRPAWRFLARCWCHLGVIKLHRNLWVGRGYVVPRIREFGCRNTCSHQCKSWALFTHHHLKYQKDFFDVIFHVGRMRDQVSISKLVWSWEDSDETMDDKRRTSFWRTHCSAMQNQVASRVEPWRFPCLCQRID